LSCCTGLVADHTSSYAAPHPQAEPSLLPSTFSRHAPRGQLPAEAAPNLARDLLPASLAAQPAVVDYVAAQLTAGSPEPQSLAQLRSSVKGSRSAYKEAAAMARLSAEGQRPSPDVGCSEVPGIG
jgi:hypothetical protein